jgi:osmotically inducible lipoprotein OsmB
MRMLISDRTVRLGISAHTKAETKPERKRLYLRSLNRSPSLSGNHVLAELDMVCSIGKAGLALVFALGLLSAGACSRTQQYLATGAAVGAGGGAVVAAATGGSVVGGAIVGGALGTGGGYILSRQAR